MSYASEQDMVDRYGRQEIIDLTDRDNTGAIDPAVLAKALIDADAEIDIYLGGRYALPLSTVPGILVGIACDVARYRLLENRRHEVAEDRYKAAVRILTDLSNGRAHLGLDAAQQAPAPGTGPTASAPDRLFTTSRLQDF